MNVCGVNYWYGLVCFFLSNLILVSMNFSKGHYAYMRTMSKQFSEPARPESELTLPTWQAPEGARPVYELLQSPDRSGNRAN
jgi:hypothetical protein